MRCSYQSLISHLLPSTVLLQPGCHIKIPWRRLKKCQWLFFPSMHTVYSSGFKFPTEAHVQFCVLSIDWPPRLQIQTSQLPLDLSTGMSHGNSKGNTLQNRESGALPPSLPLFLSPASFPWSILNFFPSLTPQRPTHWFHLLNISWICHPISIHIPTKLFLWLTPAFGIILSNKDWMPEVPKYQCRIEFSLICRKMLKITWWVFS